MGGAGYPQIPVFAKKFICATGTLWFSIEVYAIQVQEEFRTQII